DLVLVFKGTRGPNDKTDFTLNASQTDEFQVTVDASIPSTADHPMIGSIGFLPVTAVDSATVDNTALPTRFPRPFVADMGNSAGLSNPRLNGAAEIQLQLTSAISVSTTLTLPHIDIGLDTTRTFSDSPTQGASDTFGDAPTISLHDISLNVGSLMSSTVAPLASDLKTFIEPIEPYIKAQTDPLPVISALQGDTSLNDLLLAANITDSNLASIIDFAGDVATVIDNLDAVIAALGGVDLPLGSFDLGGPADDLRDPLLPAVDFGSILTLPALAD